jgi:hypothetical protein
VESEEGVGKERRGGEREPEDMEKVPNEENVSEQVVWKPRLGCRHRERSKLGALGVQAFDQFIRDRKLHVGIRLQFLLLFLEFGEVVFLFLLLGLRQESVKWLQSGGERKSTFSSREAMEDSSSFNLLFRVTSLTTVFLVCIVSRFFFETLIPRA